MNVKVYLVGLGGGLLLEGALYYPLYRFLPTLVTAEWPPADLSPARVGLGLAALLLLGAGALAAKSANTLAGALPPREERRELRQADTSTLKEEIDRVFCQMYVLTKKEHE